MEREFTNWVEASEFLRYDYSEEAMRWAKWYQRAPSSYKREVEADNECVRQGWIPPHIKLNKTKGVELKTNKTKDNFIAPAFKSNKPGVKTELNKDKSSGAKLTSVKDEFKCHACGGTGHKISQCPSKDAATKKEGSKCHKCGGKDHWAPSCPTVKPGPTPKTAAYCVYEQGNEEA